MNILERFSLDGKKALVTGAGRGLGQAYAHALAEAGADVAIAEIDVEAGEKVVEELRGLGRDSFFIMADVSKRADAIRMVDAVVSRWGRLEVAVNNAAISLTGDPDRTWLCTRIDGQSQDGGVSFVVTYEFQIRRGPYLSEATPPTYQGWDAVVVYIDPETDKPIQEPVWGETIKLVRVYPEMDFAALNIGL